MDINIIVLFFRARYPYYEIVESDRGTPLFIHDENTKFSVEELVAQLLAKAKDFSEISHGKFIFNLFSIGKINILVYLTLEFMACQ